MPVLALTYAPHPIFKSTAHPVTEVTEEVRALADSMLETLYFERAVGIGANMVGVLQRIAVVDLQIEGVRSPLVLINPVITWYSEEVQTFKEASLCFRGIDADITRPKAIKVSYLDYQGTEQTLAAEGFLASVIQHEIDYLDGTVFLDHLPRLKRDMLLKKMLKHIKMHPPHVHGAHCHH